MSQVPNFDVKDQVKQATDVVDLIGSEMNLRRQGSIYVGHCPWHDDQKPSFQVNPNKQNWVCYPCDVRGDVFDFVMKREGVDFREALEILAERAGIEVRSYQKKVVKGSADDKATLYRAMAWAEQEYHECLLNSDSATPIRDYLVDRGITQESIERFRVGFAPLSWSWLVDRSSGTSFSPEILQACGLVSANDRGGWYERFRGRVLFPIRDTQERTIALGGRVVPSLYPNGDAPPAKYVNSPETRLFSKSKNLYALNLARNYVQKTSVKDKRLVIVEGYTDVVAAWQAGLTNVVAALGVALNEQHIRLIKRFADGITLVLDGDEAGQRTMNTVLDLFVAHDVDLRILSLPDGLDPFDFLMAEGGGAFQALVDKAPDAIAHKILVETRGVDLVNDTHRSNQALENILKTLANIPEDENSTAKSIREDQMLLRLGRQFQLAPEMVRRRLTDLRRKTRVRPDASDSEVKKDLVDYSKFDKKESELVQLLIQDPSLLDRAVENVSPEQFRVGVLRDLYELMGEFFHEGRGVGYQQLTVEIEEPRLRKLVDHLRDEAIAKKEIHEEQNSAYAMDFEDQLQSIILRFNEREVESGTQAKISKLHSGGLDEDEEKRALEELFRQQLQKPNNSI
ncbi:MAG: DNA primase [Mariniblastus sp.]|nr:DNA primase [Mariniblastus sp.]MDG2180925.1 DNA primase [Mariniblastus sp.]